MFQRSGKALAGIGRLAADFDFPDTLRMVANRPILMAGNHRSLFDLVATMAIFTQFDVSSHILVRADLMEKGPGAKFLHGIGCIPASSSKRVSAERAAIGHLLDGKVVSIMPEGRLVRESEWVNGVGPGRPGVSRIARAAGAVVIPVGFSGTEKVWPRGRPPKLQWPRPTVRIRIGDPIDFDSDDHVANARVVMEAVSHLVVDP